MTEGVVGNSTSSASSSSEDWDFTDVLYSFGVANPGAITIHNYPNFLRELNGPTAGSIDLASVDIMRDRERGVPRYNRFLEFMHKKPIRSFDDLANPQHPGLPEELRRIYGQTDGRDNVDRLDLMVGLFCRDAAAGLRLQRHRVPHLHPDGVAPAQERSLHRQGFHRRRLYQRRHRLGERQQPGQHACVISRGLARRSMV